MRGRGGVREWRPVRVAIGLLCVSGLMVGCTPGDDDVAPSSSTAVSPSGPELPEGWERLSEASPVALRVDETALWDSTAPDAPVDVRDVAVRGDAAIFVGAGGVAVVDAVTGRPRWHVELTSELPGGEGALLREINLVAGRFLPVPLVDVDGSWAVVVGYVLDPSDPSMSPEYGVAALAAADGHLLWKRSVVPAGQLVPNHTTNWVQTVVSDGHTAFVTAFTGPDERLTRAERVRDTKLVAVDGRTGEVRWERMGVDPQVIAGDIVAGLEPASTASGSDAPELVGVLLDKATGEPWSVRFESYSWVEPVEATGDLAVLVAGTDAEVDGGDLALVDLTTGAELANMGRASGRVGTCGTDGRLIACQVRDEDTYKMHLGTYDIAAESGAMSAEGWPELTIHAVWQGGVLASTGSGTTKLLDQAGDVVQELPGYFVAASDQFVVMRDVPPITDYAIYQVAD